MAVAHNLGFPRIGADRELKKALAAYQDFLKHGAQGEKSALALKRISEIYLRLDQPEQALTRLERIAREYPEYAWIPGVLCEIVQLLSNTGRYELSQTKAREWLEKYPDHPLKREIFLIMGNNCHALDNRVGAFAWWLKAEEAMSDSPRKLALVHEKLTGLIAESGPELLTRLAEGARGTRYAPLIYYRLAQVYLQQDQTDQAMDAAAALLNSTGDEAWLSKGRELLDRIEEETAVRQGKVGCLLPLTGPFSIFGRQVLKGIELGLDLNRDQDDQPALDLLVRDTGGGENKARRGLEDLALNEKVMAVIGPVASRTAAAVAGNAQEMGVPLITLTQRAAITCEGDMIFRNFITPSREIAVLVDAAVNRFGLKQFGILYPDNAYGRYCMNRFWDRVNDLGGAVTAVESYGVDDTDFAEQIKKMVGLYYPRPESLIKKLEEMKTPEDEESAIYSDEPEPIIDFDAVFIPDSFQRVAMIAPQLAFYDVLDVRLLGTSAWQSPRLIELARDYIQGALFCSGFVADSQRPEVRAFVEQYRENYGTDPGVLAANGYDTIRLLKSVLSQGGIRTRKDLAKALLQCNGFQGVTGVISFDSTGDAQQKPLLLTISGDRMVPLQ